MDQKQTISTLNDLVETLKDGQHGYLLASEDVQDHDLKSLFASYSLQRSKFAGELQNELIRMGEAEPQETSTVTSALHRGWINLKTALTGKDRKAILNECERGDDHALKVYEKALGSKSLPAPLEQTVKMQHQDIVTAYNTVKSMRNASGGSASLQRRATSH